MNCIQKTEEGKREEKKKRIEKEGKRERKEKKNHTVGIALFCETSVPLYMGMLGCYEKCLSY